MLHLPIWDNSGKVAEFNGRATAHRLPPFLSENIVKDCCGGFWLEGCFYGSTDPESRFLASAGEFNSDGRSMTAKQAPNGIAARQSDSRLLLIVIIAQCILYGAHVTLLPMWGDEAFTVQTMAESPARIIEIVRQDIHPPLYFLLAHWWNCLPIAPDPLQRLRILSVLFVIATTVFVERLWLRSVPKHFRRWFLLFWTLSPCLLLFGRMGRSYSLQMLLATIAIWYLLAFANNPTTGKLVAFTLSLGALLYTHYLPGIALWSGANLLLLLSWKGRSHWKWLILCNGLVAMLYVPWLLTLAGSLQQWERYSVHSMTGNIWAEQIVKLFYCFYSFTFGEAIPVWLLPVTLLIVIPCLWLLFSGAQQRNEWLWPAVFTSAVAYAGATRWASVPFMSARLLFLLPLFLALLAAGVIARHRMGALVGVAVIGCNIAGIAAYFNVNEILNVAYTTPNARIAEEIALHSQPADTAVWMDGLNFDDTVVQYYLPASFRVRELTSPESVAAARAELDTANIRHVWFLRSVHDISAGQLFGQLESQMMAAWPEHTLHSYVELSPTHLAVLHMLALLRHQDQSRPPYMYQMWEFRRSVPYVSDGSATTHTPGMSD